VKIIKVYKTRGSAQAAADKLNEKLGYDDYAEVNAVYSPVLAYAVMTRKG
jgi:hypothetical protein